MKGIKKSKIGLAMRRAGALALAFSVFAASAVQCPWDVAAHSTAAVNVSLGHADDCECKVADLSNGWYIPGSTHKFNVEFSLFVEGLTNGIKKIDASDVIGLECEYRSKDGSTVVKSEGTSVWYRIDDNTDHEGAETEVRISYTGYKLNGNTYDETEDVIGGGILKKADDFYLMSSSCNPAITIKGNTSQQLIAYAQHFTRSDPYGSSVVDVSSWVDWSQVRLSGSGLVKVSSTGLLTASSTNRGGEFEIGIYPGILKLPDGVLLETCPGVFRLRGNVIPDSSTSQGNQNPGGSSGDKNNTNNNKKITVSRPVITSLKNVKGRKIAVKWKKVKDAASYQIQYSTDKKFKKDVKSKKLKKTGITLPKLKKNKKYFVRVRACQKVSGVTYQSKWSKVKNVKVKK